MEFKSTKKPFAKKAGEFVGKIFVGVVIAVLVFIIFYMQFKVYQKKYGDHMTFFDFLVDPETGN